MFKDCNIKNFRVFKEMRIEGFERINLIGGGNNVGKTALLEALFLLNSPEPQSILFLKKYREESFSTIQKNPEQTWANFFFNCRKDSAIELRANNQINENGQLSEKIRTVRLTSEDKIKTNFNKSDIENLEKNLTDSSKYILSALNINSYLDNYEQEKNHTLIADPLRGINISSTSANDHFILSYLNKTAIFCSDPLTNHQELAKNYDIAILNNKAHKILNILKTLDLSIEEIRTLNIGEPDVYLRRKNEPFLPISLFGNCFKQVLNIILQLVNAKNSVCFIDKIDNGIHYQNHRELWVSLFNLAIESNSQIFAITHNLEMIQAFAGVGLTSYPDQAAYFELARNKKTNEIVSIKRDLELLHYSLKHKKGLGLRGE